MQDAVLAFADGGWTLVEDQLRTGDRPTAALFTTSSGYLGLRRPAREPVGDHGLVLVRGLHERRPYAHPERSFGIPEHAQTLVPATDPTVTTIVVDGVAVLPGSGTWLDHQRRLDLRTGVVTTTGTWCAPGRQPVSVRSRRLVSLAAPTHLWWEVEVEPLEGEAQVEVGLALAAPTGDRTFPGEPEAIGRAWGRFLRPAGHALEDDVAALVHATGLSGRSSACAARLDASAPVGPVVVGDDRIVRAAAGRAGPGRALRAAHRAVHGDGPATEAAAVLAAVVAAAHRAGAFDAAVRTQRAVLDRFWAAADVLVDGDAEVEAAVRYSIFQVFQASIGNPDRAASAKGLSGQGYEGHHLWDQEIHLGHALDLVAPEATRPAIAFRCATLPQAEARARRLSHRGAQFPWRTIDGTEASAFFPAGAAQYHVDAAIAWAIDHHVACTGDTTVLHGGGLAVLVGTARFWECIGRYDEQGRFHIEGVTGPDEYTALVDDNLYTNLMAARNLLSAADRVDALDGEARAALGVDADEVASWRRAAESVVVPYDEALGLHGQDSSFLGLPEWDLASTPPGERPLQDHHHLLTLYRRQVLKQADVVLALFLLRDRFTAEERRRAFDHYEPLTTHDSSLSKPIHAIVAADVGRLDLAWRYTRDAALLDLDGEDGTLEDGLHLASAAGAWLAIACGFGGYRLDDDGTPTVAPKLPPGVARLRFRVRHRGSLLEVDIGPSGADLRLVDGAPLEVVVDGERREVR